MNINTVTVALLRLTSLVLLYFIVIHISHLIHMIDYSDWSGLLMSVLALLMLSTAATVFWFYPAQFSSLLFRNTESTEPTTNNSTGFVHAGVILLGLTLFTLAFIDLTQWFIYSSIINHPVEIHQANMHKAGIFYILARLIIAVLLLVNSYWLTRFLLNLNSPEKVSDLNR